MFPDTKEVEETTESKDKAMLTTLEARILGSLMEKQLTTPDAYPLTLNSLQLACNQKTNREPVMNLQERALQQCLNGLSPKMDLFVICLTMIEYYEPDYQR